MRFYDLLAIICLISMFSVISNFQITGMNKLNETNMELINKSASSKFISESFRKTCWGQGFGSLNEWQKKCAVMWNLEYIGWTTTDSFMEDFTGDRKKIYYGTWKGKYGSGEVYVRGLDEK